MCKPDDSRDILLTYEVAILKTELAEIISISVSVRNVRLRVMSISLLYIQRDGDIFSEQSWVEG